MDLLKPRYSKADEARLELLRSRLNVARAVLSARLDLGLTQAELGERAGTKQSRVSEIEAMKGNPRFDTLDRISMALGLMLTLVPRERTADALAIAGYHEIEHTTKQVGARGNVTVSHITLPQVA